MCILSPGRVKVGIDIKVFSDTARMRDGHGNLDSYIVRPTRKKPGRLKSDPDLAFFQSQSLANVPLLIFRSYASISILMAHHPEKTVIHMASASSTN